MHPALRMSPYVCLSVSVSPSLSRSIALSLSLSLSSGQPRLGQTTLRKSQICTCSWVSRKGNFPVHLASRAARPQSRTPRRVE